MEDGKYQAISGVDNVLRYLGSMNGFHGFPIGNLSYDGSVFSITIEEVLEGEDWPDESNGRIWALEFSHVSDIDINIDTPLGLWIDTINIGEDGAFVIHCNQGDIVLIANNAELFVPITEFNQLNNSSSSIDAGMSALKGVFNDIKGAIMKRRNGADAVAPPVSANATTPNSAVAEQVTRAANFDTTAQLVMPDDGATVSARPNPFLQDNTPNMSASPIISSPKLSMSAYRSSPSVAPLTESLPSSVVSTLAPAQPSVAAQPVAPTINSQPATITSGVAPQTLASPPIPQAPVSAPANSATIQPTAGIPN